jgi:hypothetical protein
MTISTLLSLSPPPPSDFSQEDNEEEAFYSLYVTMHFLSREMDRRHITISQCHHFHLSPTKKGQEPKEEREEEMSDLNSNESEMTRE